MKLPEQGLLLRIFIGESDKYKGMSLYEAIVLKARKLKMAGVTVTKGIMGFGAHSHLHSAKILSLSDDLPIIIEIVDTEDRINSLLPFLDEHIKDGMVTLEKVRVIKYRACEREK